MLRNWLNSAMMTFLGLMFVAGLGIAIVGSLAWQGATESVTELEEYETLIAELRGENVDSPLLQHFPNTVPESAIKPRLYFLPGFLQGGTIFQLSLELPLDEFEAEKGKFRAQSIHLFQAGISEPPIPEPELHFESVQVSFPNTYQFIVLGAHPHGNENFIWNHGSIYGVAIDQEAQRIVYWLEDW